MVRTAPRRRPARPLVRPGRRPRRHGTPSELRLVARGCLKDFVLSVLLAARRQFRGARNGEAVEVLDDTPQMVG